MSEQPRPPCPCCGLPLTVQVTVYCARGACPSDVSNDGATSDTIDKAVAKLAEMVNDELARKENAGYWDY